MTADVQERPESALLVTHQNDGTVTHAGRDERAGRSYLVLPTNVLPRVAKDPLLLELENGRVRVPAPRKGSRADGTHDRERYPSAGRERRYDRAR